MVLVPPSKWFPNVSNSKMIPAVSFDKGVVKGAFFQPGCVLFFQPWLCVNCAFLLETVDF